MAILTFMSRRLGVVYTTDSGTCKINEIKKKKKKLLGVIFFFNDTYIDPSIYCAG